jgi:hypothetical protein
VNGGTGLWRCCVRHSMSQHLFRLCYGVSGDGLKLFIFPHNQTCLVKEKWKADVKKGTISADWTMKVPVPTELIMYDWTSWREKNETEEQCSYPNNSDTQVRSVPDPLHFSTDPRIRMRILGPLTNGYWYGYCSFRQWPSRWKKIIIYAYSFLKVYLHHSSKIIKS